MSSKSTRVSEQTESIPHQEIARRAYDLWQERGCPIGSPEEDWLRAEEEIRRQRAQPVAGRSKGVRTRARAASAG